MTTLAKDDLQTFGGFLIILSSLIGGFQEKNDYKMNRDREKGRGNKKAIRVTRGSRGKKKKKDHKARCTKLAH
jgi:hypothetical protein